MFNKSSRFTHWFFLLLIGLGGVCVPILSAQAVCPVCAVVVGVGVGLSRWLGIDDVITGLWIGGLLVSLIGWTVDWLNKIKIRFYGRKILVTLLYYLITIWPLYHWGIMGLAENKILRMDRLLFGIIVGTFTFLFSVIGYEYMKKHNHGRAYFVGQKVVMPVGILLLLSAILYISFL